jgi:hypothetical protein
VGTRTSARADFEDFVAVCSGRLWRTAYLLTADATAAERLLDSALARAWSRWQRLEAPPEHAVRMLLVEVTTRWWGRRPQAVAGDGVWARWTRLGRRERAVVVLRLVDGLDEADTAVVAGCAQRMVGPLLDAALARLGTRDPVPALTAAASDTDVQDLRGRLGRVDDGAHALRRGRRARSLLATTLAAVAAVGAVSVVPRLVPDGASPLPVQPTPTLPSQRPAVPPPRLLDRQLPSTILANQVLFVYQLSEESARGTSLLRATVAPGPDPQALAWVAPRGQPGRVVVHVDGTLIMRSPTGRLVTGLVLAPNRPHEVVLRATRPGPEVRLGLAVYRYPQP